MIAKEITDRASVLLLDPTQVRWTEEQLIDYLNDGQREVVIHRPDASTRVEVISLTDGSTRQAVPVDAIRLLDVTRNMGTTGSTPGLPIMQIERNILDTQIPDWHSSTPQTKIKHYTYNARTPDVFFVYPRPGNSVKVEVIVSVPPSNVSSSAAQITISAIYANALLDYILYRCFSKDSEYADPNKAVGYYNAFLQSLGTKTQVDVAMVPKQKDVRA